MLSTIIVFFLSNIIFPGDLFGQLYSIFDVNLANVNHPLFLIFKEYLLKYQVLLAIGHSALRRI